MKKLLFTALAIAAFGATQTSAMSYHDNDIYLSSNVRVVSYEITASCVTDGQDPNGDLNPGKFAVVDGNDAFMLHCGRHNSSTVGDWIKSHAAYEETILTSGRSALPNKANFATIGTMSLMYNGTLYGFNNILFAQYGCEGNNLWIISQVGASNLGWFGKKKCATIYGHSIGGFQADYATTSRISLPLCSSGTCMFLDDADELKGSGYSPVEIVNR